MLFYANDVLGASCLARARAFACFRGYSPVSTHPTLLLKVNLAAEVSGGL